LAKVPQADRDDPPDRNGEQPMVNDNLLELLHA
jgi:hypothetical protein